jgi:hypothetical protein
MRAFEAQGQGGRGGPGSPHTKRTADLSFLTKPVAGEDRSCAYVELNLCLHAEASYACGIFYHRAALLFLSVASV